MERYKKIFVEHSKEFLKILKESPADQAIRAITHKQPLLVFWVNPDGIVLDAKNAHFDNPPNNDRSVLSHKTHKGHLRGRAAQIGDVIYIVIYGESFSSYQEALLRRSYPKILQKIASKNKQLTQKELDNTIFIQEDGERIMI